MHNKVVECNPTPWMNENSSSCFMANISIVKETPQIILVIRISSCKRYIYNFQSRFTTKFSVCFFSKSPQRLQAQETISNSKRMIMELFISTIMSFKCARLPIADNFMNEERLKLTIFSVTLNHVSRLREEFRQLVFDHFSRNELFASDASYEIQFLSTRDLFLYILYFYYVTRGSAMNQCVTLMLLKFQFLE